MELTQRRSLIQVPAIVLLIAISVAARRNAETPPASHLEAIAFDEQRGRLVLFGGARQVDGKPAGDSAETWEWDGKRWHQMPGQADGPGARRGHALGYDPSSERVVLVGGVQARSGGTVDDPLDDTWFYDGRRWSRGPDAPVMFGHRLVFDTRERALLLLGFIGREVHVGRQLTIWRWTGGAWAAVDSTGPMLLGPARVAYDSQRSVLVVPVVDDTSSRVWEWNARAWRSTDAPGPGRRTRSAVAYDGATHRVVLVGGRGEPSREMLGDAWSWDGERWTAWPDGARLPDPRASASLVYDSREKRLLLYGGVVPKRGLVSDLWLSNAAAWMLWTPGPPAPLRQREAP